MLAIDTLYDWLSLRLVPGMNRARFYALFSNYPTPEAVFGSTISKLVTIKNFTPELAAAVLASNATDRGKRHMDIMGRAGIRVVTRDCEEYPFNLAHSALAPPMIFVKGTLAPEDKYSVALVGSRHATTYGRSVARELAGGLARYGLTVVSGFARGIDGEAHHSAVLAGGRTLAVLGNGLDVCYPSEHRALAEEVVANGALISEYPLGTPPERYNFPERNHVIASLSLATVVVEAAERSGSLITARLALDENRFVFAVPGDITRNNSRGANCLIQGGAHLVQRAQDVLFEMKDVLRGYLDVDELSAIRSQAATAIAECPVPPPSFPLPPITDGERRVKKKPEWVDAISGLNTAELEKLAAKLQLDGSTPGDTSSPEEEKPAPDPETTAPPKPPAQKPPSPLAAAYAFKEKVHPAPAIDNSGAATPANPQPAKQEEDFSEAGTEILGPGLGGNNGQDNSEAHTEILGPARRGNRDYTEAGTEIIGPASDKSKPDRSEAKTELVGARSKNRPAVKSTKMPLTEEELFIVGLLTHEAMVFDQIADRAFNRGMDVPRLTALLMKLELKKVIKQLPGRYYVMFT